MEPTRVFLLSPANLAGKRAAMLFRPEAGFDLAHRLRTAQGAPLDEVFSFVSGLYFRGKSAYSRAFARAPRGSPGALVITAGRGLVHPGAPVSLDDLAAFSEVPIDPADPRYAEPLLADAERLATAVGPDGRIVLLGSIATAKYVEMLLDVLGSRLYFPEPFVGMGDMQRGSILLRAARAGVELPYVAAAGAVRSRAATRARSR